MIILSVNCLLAGVFTLEMIMRSGDEVTLTARNEEMRSIFELRVQSGNSARKASVLNCETLRGSKNVWNE